MILDLGRVVGPEGPIGPRGNDGPNGPNIITQDTQTDFQGVLVGDGIKVKTGIPGQDFAGGTHAVQHAIGGADRITPASIGAAPALATNVTYYLAPTGNDTTGDGSQANPWFSISRALSAVPKYSLGRTITIIMAAGIYNYGVNIQIVEQFLGSVQIIGAYSGSGSTYTPTTIIQSTGSSPAMFVAMCQDAYLSHIRFECTNTRILSIGLRGNCRLLGTTINGSSSSVGLDIREGGNVLCPYTEITRNTINNCGTAINMLYGVLQSYHQIYGTGNTTSVAYTAGILQAGGYPSATTMYTSASGGRAFSGAQASAPSY